MAYMAYMIPNCFYLWDNVPETGLSWSDWYIMIYCRFGLINRTRKLNK